MTVKRSMLAAAMVLVCIAALPSVAWAQSAFAGVVKDTSGAVMPGVTVEAASPVLIEKVRSAVTDENGAYRRLRRVMDAWCALWSWPLTTDIEPPDWDQWVGGLEAADQPCWGSRLGRTQCRRGHRSRFLPGASDREGAGRLPVADCRAVDL